MLPKSINIESLKREKRILKRLNLKKLPFQTSMDEFCGMYIEMIADLKDSFTFEDDKPGMQWCVSTIKRFKVFLLIFEANEIGNEIYKELLSAKLPGYSYKTIAQIVDEGLEKGFFIKLPPRIREKHDLKIRNIRPSEDLTVEFINANIDMISSLMKFLGKHN
jgi:serine/threonine protein kinase